ncbi:MAG: DUF3486 family protein [Azonexus sp.]|nr:DUF3486 family protein [Azonexus sp.]
MGQSVMRAFGAETPLIPDPRSLITDMGRESSVGNLPEAVRVELRQRLIDNGFTDYQGLADWLAERGFEISKSSVHRFGSKIERRLAAIKASTEAARLVTEAAGDDQDARSEAVIALVQTEMFDSIVAIQEADELDDPAERLALMSSAAKNIATLARASIAQKKFRLDLQARIKARLDDLETEARSGKSGLDLLTLQRISGEVYGLL